MSYGLTKRNGIRVSAWQDDKARSCLRVGQCDEVSVSEVDTRQSISIGSWLFKIGGITNKERAGNSIQRD